MKFTKDHLFVFGGIIALISISLALLVSEDCTAGEKKITPAANTHGDQDEIADILKRGKITIGIKAGSSPPFFYEDVEKNPSSIDTDLALALGKEMGVTVVFNREAQNFNEVVDQVVDGKVDLAISKLSVTKERTMRVLFSRPYARFGHGLLVHRKKLRTKGEMKDVVSMLKKGQLSLGVISNSSYEAFAKDVLGVPPSSIKSYEKWDLVLKKLEEPGSDVEVAYRDVMEIQKYMADHYDKVVDLASIGLNGPVDKIAIAIHRDHGQLKYWVDEFLDRYLPGNLHIRESVENNRKKCEKLMSEALNNRYVKKAQEVLCPDLALDYLTPDSVMAIYKDLKESEKQTKK